MSTAKKLTEELGAGEAIAAYAAEAETVICQLSPELDYNRADLYGFIAAAWPYDGEPADAAAEFVNALTEQRKPE